MLVTCPHPVATYSLYVVTGWGVPAISYRSARTRERVLFLYDPKEVYCEYHEDVDVVSFSHS